MPRLTIKELSSLLNHKTEETNRLIEVNARLQEALSEQGEVLRNLGSRPITISAKPVESHCPVCFEPLSDMDPTLQCSHEICRKCCLKHFSENSTCPMCRKTVTSKELWKFRNPDLSKYWTLLRGDDWPKFGDFVVVTTTLRTLVGRYKMTSNDKKSITIAHLTAEWEIPLKLVHEIIRAQYLVDNLPVREDGLRRVILNEQTFQ